MNPADLPQRHRPIHLPLLKQHNRSTIVFVTLCTKDRRPLLAGAEAAALLADAWRSASFWQVGRYVVMRDHVHFFCAPGVQPPHPLSRWMSFWQRQVSQHWPTRDDLPLWQKDYWDRQLRSGESYDAKWEYVRWNPVRHGLVTQPEAWPYQGELHVLHWHD
jgi:REP element-mobilizing transposase RayT